jgi:methionyl-tRNA formyltransferase
MSVAPGSLRCDGKGLLAVAAADGWVYVDEVQMAGKRRMNIKELLLGWRDAAECTFA